MSGWALAEKAKGYAEENGLPNPVQRFTENAHRAKARGIEWKLSFDEWWGIWEPFYSKRGLRKGEYVLCRTLDSGPYEIGNVRVDFAQSNGHDRVSSRVVNDLKVGASGYLKDKDRLNEFMSHNQHRGDPLYELLSREEDGEFIFENTVD